MNSLVESVINKYRMITKGDSIVVALSGGADSVAMLDVLYSLKEKYLLKIYVMHINHGIRGEEAQRDEAFCRQLADSYGLEIYISHFDVPSLAKKQKISEELCGRNIRYAELFRLAREKNAKIATAHTASDNAETLIFNLTRGSSISGMSAIPPKRDIIIRPLIECTRQQIETYCREKHLAFVTDSTNLSDNYTRNRIRHMIIPELKSINPQLETALLRFSENARSVCEYLEKSANSLIDSSVTAGGYDCVILQNADKIVRTTAISLLCKAFAGFTPESRHIALIEKIIFNSGCVELTKEVSVVSKQGILRFAGESGDDSRLIELNSQLKAMLERNTFTALPKTVCFRFRKSTDKFKFPKRNITKPIRKAMNEARIPSEIRENLYLLADGDTVLWCQGLGFTDMGEKYNSDIELLLNELKLDSSVHCSNPKLS